MQRLTVATTAETTQVSGPVKELEHGDSNAVPH